MERERKVERERDLGKNGDDGDRGERRSKKGRGKRRTRKQDQGRGANRPEGLALGRKVMQLKNLRNPLPKISPWHPYVHEPNMQRMASSRHL
jgi:hypothetical protein